MPTSETNISHPSLSQSPIFTCGTPPGTEVSLLAIRTTESPVGVDAQEGKMVAIYLPLAYMIGGPVFYVPAAHVKEIDMTVETAMKLCATAQVGMSADRADEGPAAARKDLPDQTA